MSQVRKNFLFKNEEFTCENCGAFNPLGREIRNHCAECLFSKHVDETVPGDRGSECGGLMKPITVYKNKNKGFMIKFECVKCGVEYSNRVLDSDNMDLVANLSANGYHEI